MTSASTPEIRIHAPKSESGWLWCLHCMRAFRYGEFRPEGKLQMCPYEGCDGGTGIDAWCWDDHQPSMPHWPKVPERNVRYPLYKYA